MSTKLSSRKFWICVGVAATGIGTTIAGLVIPNEMATLACTICGAVLTGIGGTAYALAEALIDKASVEAVTNSTITSVSATASSAKTVESLLLPPTPAEDSNVKVGGTE